MIAALYVMPGGCYFGLPGVDPWGEARDARLYDGPYAVVAHPPCARWCRLAGLVEARWGHKRGDDGGCFAAALSAVRRFGGVLEHPAYSAAWAAHGLRRPQRADGWVLADEHDGWTCYTEQGEYGHVAKKATWLYAVGTARPVLRQSGVSDANSTRAVSWCGNKTKSLGKRPLVSAKLAKATPLDFRDLLIGMARSVGPR